MDYYYHLYMDHHYKVKFYSITDVNTEWFTGFYFFKLQLYLSSTNHVV